MGGEILYSKTLILNPIHAVQGLGFRVKLSSILFRDTMVHKIE